MKKYLVVGVYEDDYQRWADTFEAASPEKAEKLAPYGVIVAAVIDEETCEVVL